MNSILFFLSVSISVIHSLQSDTNFRQFTPKYYAEWYTHDNDGDLKVRFTLRIKDFDISSWGTQSGDGLWLGLGFGSRDHSNADMVICQFRYTGQSSANDKFTCIDRHSNSNQLPPLDNIDNIIDISTTKTYYQYQETQESQPITYINAEAVFERLLDTNDIQHDYIFHDRNTISASWAYGFLNNNVPAVHQPTSYYRNGFTMAFYSIDGASILNNLAHLMSITIALFTLF